MLLPFVQIMLCKLTLNKKAPKFSVSDTHWAKTWLLHENAPKVEKPGVIADLHDKIRDKMGLLLI